MSIFLSLLYSNFYNIFVSNIYRHRPITISLLWLDRLSESTLYYKLWISPRWFLILRSRDLLQNLNYLETTIRIHPDRNTLQYSIKAPRINSIGNYQVLIIVYQFCFSELKTIFLDHLNELWKYFQELLFIKHC